MRLTKKTKNSLKTFSIGFPDSPFHDESAYANLVAEKYKTEHTLISLGEKDYFESIPKVLDYFGEPFADSSAIAVHILCERVGQHVKVALSGDGADEVFGGYNKYSGEYLLRNSNLMLGLLKVAGPVAKFLPQSRDNRLSNLSRQLSKLYKGSRLEYGERYFQWLCFSEKSDVENILSKEMLDYLEANKEEVVFRYDLLTKEVRDGGSDLNSTLLADVKTVLPNDMLHKVDSMSMANSLEVRVPFLDHELVEFAFSIKASHKIDGNFKKKILQETFKDHLPQELYRRKKQGFSVPLNKWFAKKLDISLGKGLVSLSSLEESKFFDISKVEHYLKKMRDNPVNDHQALVWSLVVLDAWIKNTDSKLQ